MSMVLQHRPGQGEGRGSTFRPVSHRWGHPAFWGPPIFACFLGEIFFFFFFKKRIDPAFPLILHRTAWLQKGLVGCGPTPPHPRSFLQSQHATPKF